MREFTLKHKMMAIQAKYYQHLKWEPKVGDFYTIVRDDLKLFQIVKEENGEFYFKCNEYDDIGSFPSEGFTTEGFGPNRVWIPEWVFKALDQPSSDENATK